MKNENTDIASKYFFGENLGGRVVVEDRYGHKEYHRIVETYPAYYPPSLIDKEMQEEYEFGCMAKSEGWEDDFYKSRLAVKKGEQEFIKEMKEEDPEWVRERRMAYLEPIIKIMFADIWELGCHLEERKKVGGFYYELAEAIHGKTLEEWNGKYKRMVTEYGILKGNLTFDKNQITDEDIAVAKELPIENFLQFNKSGFSNCLWHEEKTGSLKLYREKNRVHCFGCNKSADVIDLVMKIHSLDFIPAVRYLLSK